MFTRFEALEGRALMATIYVNGAIGSDANNGSTADPVQTIQAGVNLAVAGDTVEVASGTYAENITINKALTLMGANAGVDPNTGTRGPETIIEPAVDDSQSGVILDVIAPNVILDGFTVDGANPLLSGGVSLNGTNVNAATGITTSNKLTVQNDIIQNLDQTGILASGNGNSISLGSVFSNNEFDNIPSLTDSGTGIRVTNDFYATITGNVLTRVATAIQIDTFSRLAPSQAGIVDSNTATFYESGIYVNNLSGSAAPWTISNNTVTYIPLDSTASSSGGLFLLSMHANSPSTIENNNVIGATYGVELWNDWTSAIEVQGGTLTGNQIGVWATNTDPTYGAGAALNAIVSGVNVTGSTIDGVLIDADPAAASTVSLTVQNSTIADGAVGVEVTGSLSTFVLTSDIITSNQTGVQIDAGTVVSSSDKLSNSSITANTVAGLVHDGAGALNARSNFWGSSTGPTYPANSAGVGQTIIDLTDGGTGTGIVLFNPYLKATPFTPIVNWADPADITYGTALDDTELDAIASVPGSFAYTPAPGTVLSAGAGQTLSVTFTPTDAADYNSVTTTATINVGQAQLTVTADNQSIAYGSSVPTLTDTVTGFVNGDDASVVSGTPALSTTASSSDHPGSYPITIDVSGLSAANYTFVGQDGTLTITAATPTITWTNPAAITYGTALSATQLDAATTVLGSFVYAPAAGTVLTAGAGKTLSVTFTPTDTVDYNPETVTATINVQKATPVVTWANPAAITYGTALSATQLDATASLPGSFVYTPAMGTVLAAGAGQTLAVTFTPTDTIDYNTATETAPINVTKAQLTVAANNQSMTYGGSVPAFSYTITGFVNGDHASVVSGTPLLTTTASQSSRTGSYPIAVNVTQLSATNYTFAGQNGTLTISPATPIIIWSNPAAITYGTALSAIQLDATTTVPGSFRYTPAAGTVLSAGAGQTLSVTFTPTDSADYIGATTTATINVQKATPVLTWANPVAITYGTALSATQLDATTTVPGSFTYTPATGTVLTAGTGQTLSVTFTPTDSVDYIGATTTATINVQKATPVVTWANPAAITYGTALSATQLDATTTVPGSFVYSPAPGTVPSAGSNVALSVTFTPTDTADYNPATTTTSVDVNKAQLTVAADNESTTYGGPLPAFTYNITGFVNGDSASVVSGNPLLATTASSSSHPGAYPIAVDVTRLSATNYTFGGQDGTLTVAAATPAITWANPADISYGTALSATQLDATTTVPGSFVYTPATGTVLSVGAGQTLSVAFTPTDTVDYNPVTIAAAINVQNATPVLTWANPADISYGTALSATQLDATTTVPGSFVYTPATGTVLSVGAGRTLSVTFTPTDTSDYNAVTTTATINVQTATPVLTWANPAAITYGSALSATQFDATTNVPGSFVYSPAPGTVLSAGANETLSVTFTPTDTTHYAPVTATAMINVNRAPLLIAANSATKVYGQQVPAFTVTYAGLTNGDLPSSLGGSLGFNTAATASSPVNTYSVVPGGLTSPNYAITFVGAKLVVTPASLTITANNQSRSYGQSNPPLTADYQGFVNGDTPASLTAPLTVSTPAVPASSAGSYTILVAGAVSPDYAIRFVNGTLTITPPTNPIVLGRIAFVTSLYRDLLRTPPGPADLFSWLQQLNAGKSLMGVATAINQSPARRAILRAHHALGISFNVALQRAINARQLAIQNAQPALKHRHR